MAYENEPRRRTEIDYSPIRRISWGAVFAGFILAFVVNLSLNLLGLGIGIGTVDPMQQDAVSGGLGTGAIIWYVLGVIISLVLGGWVAAHLSGIPDRLSGMLHGLLAWCIFTVFTLYLLTTAIGSAIGVTGQIAGQALSLAGQGVSAVAPEVGSAVQQEFDQSGIIQNIKQEVEQMAQGAAENPEQLEETINKIFSEGGEPIIEEDRQVLANVIAEQTNMSETEARSSADRWINQYQEARQEFDQLKQNTEQKARKVAEDATSAVSTAAIAAFFGLLLGAIAGAGGGAMGRPKEIRETTRP